MGGPYTPTCLPHSCSPSSFQIGLNDQLRDNHHRDIIHAKKSRRASFGENVLRTMDKRTVMIRVTKILTSCGSKISMVWMSFEIVLEQRFIGKA